MGYSIALRAVLAPARDVQAQVQVVMAWVYAWVHVMPSNLSWSSAPSSHIARVDL